jgi:hypothetical protein
MVIARCLSRSRPALPNAISIPTRRRLGAARRKRPDKARAVAGQDFAFAAASPAALASAASNSVAVPVHSAPAGTSARTASATASASITVSLASA